MRTHQQNSEASNEEVGTSVGISRRQVLAGGAAGIGGLLAGGFLGTGTASASSAVGFQGVPLRG